MKIFLFIFFILLSTNKVFADNEICGDAYYYGGKFEPIVYNCASGYYLPAGAISCEQCPNNHTCNGGTFAFDAIKTQGLSDGDMLVTDAIGSCATNFNKSFTATFEPIVYTCNPGYYLPAGNDWTNDFEGCRICDKDNYCIGGNYTFNETTNQGITHCPEQYQVSPAGSYSAQQCYKPIINLDWYNGENIVAQTTCEYGSVIQLPPTPVKPGYTFVGWRLKTTSGE